MRMMSHHNFLVNVLFMDGVQSWVNVLLMDGVLSWSRHQKLQEDWISTLTGNVDIPLPGAERINPGHGTRIARGEGGTKMISISLCLLIWCRKKSWSRHQKLQEDWFGTKDEIGSSNSSLLYLPIHASIWCHRKLSWLWHQKLQEVSLYQFI